MGESSGRGRAAVVIAAEVDAATFLSQEVVESTAIIRGEGWSSSSPGTCSTSARGVGSSRVFVDPLADDPAPGDELRPEEPLPDEPLPDEPFPDARPAAAAAAAVADVRAGGAGRSAFEPFDDAGLVAVRVVSSVGDDLVAAEDDALDVERPEVDGAAGSVGATVHALALVGLARDEVVDRPVEAGVVVVGRLRGGIDGGVDSVMHPPLTGRRRWAKRPDL